MGLSLVVLAVIVPNLAMHLVAWQGGVKRPLMVIDYALFALLLQAGAAVGLRKVFWPVAFGLFLLLSASETIQYVGNVFLFDARQILEYLDFVDQWPIALVLAGAAVFAAYVVAICTLSARATRAGVRDRGAFSIAGVCAVMVLPVALLVGERGLDFLGRPNLASVQLKAIRIAVRRAMLPATVTAFGEPTLSTTLLSAPDLPPRILSVGFESLGYMDDVHEANLSLIMQRFESRLATLYTVEVGSRRFAGSTMPGEIRELCGLQLDGMATPELMSANRAACVPEALRLRGYHTVATHGFAGEFYRRDAIYPAMGFEETYFRDDLVELPRDDALGMGDYCDRLQYFVGTCDGAALLHTLGIMAAHERSFGHVMTKDLHFPFPEFTNERIACDADGRDEVEDFCAYVRFAELLFDDLATAILAAPERPDMIVVFGDHRPHTEDRKLREMFSATRVPVITLRRR